MSKYNHVMFIGPISVLLQSHLCISALLQYTVPQSVYNVQVHPNCYVIECLEKISVNEREMTIGI